MINRTSTVRIGKRVALTRSILRRFNWRRIPETTIKINCSNNGDLVADESAYQKVTIETLVIEERRKFLRLMKFFSMF